MRSSQRNALQWRRISPSPTHGTGRSIFGLTSLGIIPVIYTRVTVRANASSPFPDALLADPGVRVSYDLISMAAFVRAPGE